MNDPLGGNEAFYDGIKIPILYKIMFKNKTTQSPVKRVDPKVER